MIWNDLFVLQNIGYAVSSTQGYVVLEDIHVILQFVLTGNAQDYQK